jgi:Coenzyme PQQ synthesis protein D (PqqD)
VGLCAEPDMTQLRLKPDAVSWREVDGEIIALEHSASTYLAANASGALLWKALAHGASREELVDRLAGEFGIDRGRAAADTDEFLRAMAQQGLLAS